MDALQLVRLKSDGLALEVLQLVQTLVKKFVEMVKIMVTTNVMMVT